MSAKLKFIEYSLPSSGCIIFTLLFCFDQGFKQEEGATKVDRIGLLDRLSGIDRVRIGRRNFLKEENMTTVKERLERFIRQYYMNKILKGSIILGISFILLLLVLVTIEHLGWFNSVTRAIMFYTYLGINAGILGYYVLDPLARLTGLSGGISFEGAARIIGNHFEQIHDKLLNLLQLQELGVSQGGEVGSDALLLAAIQQKEVELKPFPFVKAIGFSKSIRTLRYFLPTLVILILIFSFKPEYITGPVNRISRYNVHFEKPAPFTFVLMNKELTGITRGSYMLQFTTEGVEIPGEAFVEINGINYKAQKSGVNKFEFEIQNLQTDVKFRMNSLDFYSVPYILKVIPRPGIKNFRIQLDYPAYTGKQKEVIDNIGDLIVPRGTIVTWRYNTYHTDNLRLSFNDKEVKLNRETPDRYSYTQRIMEGASYMVQPVNKFIDTLNRVAYAIEVIPDEYPAIRVDELHDTVNHFMIFFTGDIGDDYGFTALKYKYAQVRNGDTIMKKDQSLSIPGNELKQRFMHYSDLKGMGFQPGDQLVWYFEVQDNDRISGPKTSRSYLSTYRIPGFAELDESQQKMEEDIKEKMNQTIRSAQAIQQEAKKLNQELRSKEQLNWQDREKINQLLNRQEKIKSNIEELQKMMQHKQQKEEQFKNIDPDILEKQKLLQEMMEKLLDDETRKLLEEIQKLMDELDKNKVNEMLDKIKMTNDELNRELERNLELFKQLEIEKDLRETIDKLDQLAKEQDKLSKDSEKATDPEKIAEKQQELNKEFDRISEKLDQIDKKNKELEFPNKLENTDQEKSAIKKDMKESLDQLNQGKPKSASGKQKNASQKMEELSDKLSQMMDEMMEEQMAEDIMTLRQILKNLIHISFEQEALMKDAQKINRLDPRYPEIINKQNIIKRDFKVIEDSLTALGKRQTAIQTVVSKEISAIKENMDQAISNFLEVHTIGFVVRPGKEMGVERQQFAMTSMNNLALLLAESLDNMKQEQSQQKSGMGKQCKKPKSGQSMSQMRQRQQSLNQQLQKMREEMQKGQQPDGKRNSMSEQFARMAAEQEAIRKALGEYMQELQKQGLKDQGGLSELMKQMEKTEEELVNKMLNQNTLKRQEEIRTRLLESEKAEREREEEERRESKEVKNQIFSNPSLFLEYKRLTEKEREMLRYSTPLLQHFYKNKVNEFMIKQEAGQ
jgi:hypothetical protein